MNERDHIDEQLEAELRDLTTWKGEEAPEMWRAAMKATQSPRRWLPRIAAILLTTLMVGVIVVASLPSSRSHEAVRSADQNVVASRQAEVGVNRFHLYEVPESPGLRPAFGEVPTLDLNAILDAGSASSETAAADRHVVSSASIELRTADVRATFLRLTHLVSEAQGEYIQDSALTGDEPQDLQANVTLRISAARLSEVLNDIRALADVVSESVSGEDVTGQYVDLDARLRNEQRVEAELLGLLEGRNEAPLKDILELQRELGRVRGSIEQLQTKMNRLSHLVNLARVLVIVRPAQEEAAPPVEEEAQSMGDYFGERVAGAWRTGLEGLVGTVAAILHVLIAGLVWWTALAILLIAAIRKLRRPTATPASLPS